MSSTRNADTTAGRDKAAEVSREFFSAAAQGAQRSTEQVMNLFGLSGERSEDLTRRSSQNLETMTEASAAVARGFQDLSREWFTLVQEATQKNIDGLTALARCRSMPELLSAQADLVRNSMQQTIDGTRRMTEISTRITTEAGQVGTAQAKSTSRTA